MNKNILLIPFFSQQNKDGSHLRGFLTKSCSISNINLSMAEQLKDAGHNVHILWPRGDVDQVPKGIRRWEAEIPYDNKFQRISFQGEIHRDISAYFRPDIIISHHELQSWNLRQAYGPDVKIIQFNHMLPIGDWEFMGEQQILSWNAADLVVCLSDRIKRKIESSGCKTYVEVWPYVFPQIVLEKPSGDRDIDIIFPQRCSASNYSRHMEFLDALMALRLTGQTFNMPKVVFTDSTKYLSSQNQKILLKDVSSNIEIQRGETREEYFNLLRRSKFAVGMIEKDFHGGIAIREAISAGCIPILGNSPALDDIGKKAKDYFRVSDAADVTEYVDTLTRALRYYSKLSKQDRINIHRRLSNSLENETFPVAIYSVLASLRKLENQ